MLFQEPSLFLVHFLIKRKMKEIGGTNLERKLQQQMIKSQAHLDRLKNDMNVQNGLLRAIVQYYN